MNSLLNLSLILLCFGGLHSAPINQSNEDSELVFLQSIWRHGDRTPVFVWPNDPNQESSWPQGLGELTIEGVQQHVELGRKLRQLYDEFISREYNAKEIYVRSSNVNRTITSAMSNMLGFYGENSATDGVQSQIQSAGYQPVPVHSVPEEYDYMRALLHGNCARYTELADMVAKTPEFLKLQEDSRDIMEKMREMTGDRNLSINSIGLVVDTWRIEKHYNRPQIPGFSEQIFGLIEPIAVKTNNYKYGLDLAPSNGVDFRLETAKMHGGLLLWAMIGNMQQKRECMENSGDNRTQVQAKSCEWMDALKYYVFSAHDSTMASLFSTFGFPKTNYDSDGFPPYAACLTIELRRRRDQNREYFVKLNYMRNGESLDVTADVLGCTSSECTLDEFVQRSRPYKIEDTGRFCSTPLPTLITK